MAMIIKTDPKTGLYMQYDDEQEAPVVEEKPPVKPGIIRKK